MINRPFYINYQEVLNPQHYYSILLSNAARVGRKNLFKHKYPDDEEILTLTKPIYLKLVAADSDLDSYKELALAKKLKFYVHQKNKHNPPGHEQ